MHGAFTIVEAPLLKITKFFVPVMLGVATISGASAADLSYDFPQLVEMPGHSFDWSGFYAGVYAGYTGGRATSTASGNVTNIDANGALLGGTVGVNAQYGSFVLGLENDLAWSGAQGSAICVGNAAFNCNGRLDWLGTTKLRGGVAVDQFLIFGTAGIALGGVTATVDPIPGGATGSFSSAVWGWTVGAGAEMAVTDNISVKAEYAYYDFASVQAEAGTITTVGATDIKSHAHVAKLGVNYRF